MQTRQKEKEDRDKIKKKEIIIKEEKGLNIKAVKYPKKK